MNLFIIVWAFAMGFIATAWIILKRLDDFHYKINARFASIDEQIDVVWGKIERLQGTDV